MKLGKAQRRFFIVVLLSFLWTIMVNLILLPSVRSHENIYVFIAKCDFSTAMLIAGFFVVFALHYPNQNSKLSGKREFIILLPTLIFALLSFSPWIVAFPIPGLKNTAAGYPIYAVIQIIYFIFLGCGVLIKKYINSHGIQRMQLGLLSTGYIFSIVILLINSVYANLVGEIPLPIDRLTTNASLLFLCVAAYAMIRYRFLDIRIVIQRGTIRIVSLFVVLVFYFILLLILAEPLFTNPNSVAPWAYVALGLIILGTVEPLRKYVTVFIDKRFELHDRKQERIQKQLQIVLKSQQSLSDLEQAIRKAFQETACVDTVDYVDADDQKLIGKPALRAYLQSTGKIVICEELPYRLDEDVRFIQVNDEVKGGAATAYVPIGQSEIFVGCFMLGPRKGKVAYSAQEVSTMKLLQSQATEAFLNARLYKQAVERIRV